jgi:hypothetical protein
MTLLSILNSIREEIDYNLSKSIVIRLQIFRQQAIYLNEEVYLFRFSHKTKYTLAIFEKLLDIYWLDIKDYFIRFNLRIV